MCIFLLFVCAFGFRNMIISQIYHFTIIGFVGLFDFIFVLLSFYLLFFIKCTKNIFNIYNTGMQIIFIAFLDM